VALLHILWLFYTFRGSFTHFVALLHISWLFYTFLWLFAQCVAPLQDFIDAEIKFLIIFETGSVFLAFLHGQLFLAIV